MIVCQLKRPGRARMYCANRPSGHGWTPDGSRLTRKCGGPYCQVSVSLRMDKVETLLVALAEALPDGYIWRVTDRVITGLVGRPDLAVTAWRSLAEDQS